MKIELKCHSERNPLFLDSLKEKKVPLNLEAKRCGDVTVVYCQGRIVFRNEALTLSELVVDLLQENQDVVLDFTKVDAMDSAGLGELVSLYLLAKSKGLAIHLCGLNSRIHHLLEITNLASLFDIFPTEDTALEMHFSGTQ